MDILRQRSMIAGIMTVVFFAVLIGLLLRSGRETTGQNDANFTKPASVQTSDKSALPAASAQPQIVQKTAHKPTPTTPAKSSQNPKKLVDPQHATDSLVHAARRAVRGSEPEEDLHAALNSQVRHSDSPSKASEGEDEDKGSPPIPKEVIVAALEELKPVAKECYQELLKDFPDAAGTVRISFVFETEDGMSRVQMSEVTDQTTLFDSGLHDCLSEAVGTLVLPRTPHDTRMTVTFPFQFRPDKK